MHSIVYYLIGLVFIGMCYSIAWEAAAPVAVEQSMCCRIVHAHASRRFHVPRSQSSLGSVIYVVSSLRAMCMHLISPMFFIHEDVYFFLGSLSEARIIKSYMDLQMRKIFLFSLSSLW